MNAQIGNEGIYCLTTGKPNLHNHSNNNGLMLLLQHQEAWLLVVPYINIEIYIRILGSLQMDK
jgi:hypothetical protein